MYLLGGVLMTDVRKVFISSEVAEKLNLTSNYLVTIAKTMNFSEDEFRVAGKRTHLFSDEAVKKLSERFLKK
jgi:hypothetical protein